MRWTPGTALHDTLASGAWAQISTAPKLGAAIQLMPCQAMPMSCSVSTGPEWTLDRGASGTALPSPGHLEPNLGFSFALWVLGLLVASWAHPWQRLPFLRA